MANAKQTKMHVKVGDIVHIISGKERGAMENNTKRGKVLRVFPEENRVIVERMNFIKRHTRPNKANRQGGILEREGKIHASNVMVVCPKCNKPTRVKHTTLEDKSRVRVCVHCDELLDK